MRVRTLISVESGDQSSIKNFIETCNLLGLHWKVDEAGDEQAIKVFRMLRANEFTFEEAEFAVNYAIRVAREMMATAFEPTGICFAHGEEQERRFQQDRYDQARYCIEHAEAFLDGLKEDLRSAWREGVRPPASKRKQIADEDGVPA